MGGDSHENNPRTGQIREVISSATVAAFYCTQDMKTSVGHIVLSIYPCAFHIYEQLKKILRGQWFHSDEYTKASMFPEGKRPPRKHKCGWEDHIKMELREIGWDGMDWIDLAQDTNHWKSPVNMVMNLRVS
jgi:hypothetical protein